MKNWKKLTIGGAGLVGLGIGLPLWLGCAQWNQETSTLVNQLKEQAAPMTSKRVSFEKFDSLPNPVARYFRLVLKDGQPIIKTASISQKGEFFLNEKWIQFEATQEFSGGPAAFVWDAKMNMNPLLKVRVRDALVDGKASMNAKILSLIPVMNMKGDKKLLSAALQRYLAEAAWFPTALLPSDKLSWSEIDENRALATLTESGTTVSLEFRFNSKGEIEEVFSPSRFREVGGEFVPTPWGGRFTKFEVRTGMLIPVEGEVKWQLPKGAMPYWRGKIIEAKYIFVD